MCTICSSLRPWSTDCDYAAIETARENAVVIETTDAVASTATTYNLGIGDTFNGQYGTTTDVDWVRVQLTAGETYVFDLTSSEADTFLNLYNASGTALESDDDDGSETDSQIIYAPTVSGTYYLGLTQFSVQLGGTGRTGAYSVTAASASGPVWTVDEMAAQLTDGYWEESGRDRRSFDIAAGGELTVNLSAITDTMRALALRALSAWTEATGLIFRQVNGDADITFTRESAEFGGEAYANSIVDGDGNILSSTVNIDQEWLDSQGSTLTSYSYQTYIHEIGHALGLGHAGNYNGSAIYGVSNDARNDSWQISVMSYFSQRENTYINDTYAYIITPMMADIAAISALYGTVATQRTGNTTYGENSNAGANYAMFSTYNADRTDDVTLAMTIVDQGGNDTLDFRSDSANQRIDLRPGAISDVYGDLGTLSIALGTVIETLLAGGGNDTLVGNDAANRILGNNGSDNIDGGVGNDTLDGGAGSDWLTPGSGVDSVIGGGGTDMVSYVDAAARVVLDLVAGTATVLTETDSLSQIENVTGSIYGDLITGDANANRIRALGDYDWMVGSGGNDTFEGGTGRDTVAYSAASAGVIASLLAGSGTGGQAAGNSYVDVENLTGSSFVDRLTGNNSTNILRGLAGDDFIFGLNGADTIDGGAGRDSIEGGLGNDRITGGRGNDTIDGGADWDTALYSGTRAQYTVTALGNGQSSVLNLAGGLDGLDMLANVEVLEFADGRIYL